MLLRLWNRSSKNIVLKGPQGPPKRNFIALPSGNEAKVVGGLIGVNVVVFGGWKYAEEQGRRSYQTWMRHFTISRSLVTSHPHTLITSIFSHEVVPSNIFVCHVCIFLFVSCFVFKETANVMVNMYLFIPLSLSVWISFIRKHDDSFLLWANLCRSSWGS
jgi:hypothetical protein